MQDEKVNKQLLSVWNKTADEMNCANSFTALHVMFDEDHMEDPIYFLKSFIYHLTPDKLEKLKKLVGDEY
jgi:hypothetical protein